MDDKYVGKVCPYCKAPLVDGDLIAVCDSCGMPHHLSCWQNNMGCATFGCKGKIKEIIGADAEIANAASPVPKPAQPKETPKDLKQAEILYENRERVFMSEVPLVLENKALFIDRAKDKLFARCIFRSMTEKSVNAMLVEITCQDIWGSALGEAFAFQYLDLKAKKNFVFGQDVLIDIPEKATRQIQVAVKKVLFEDGSIIDGTDIAFTVPAPVYLSEHFGSKELAEQYARETVPEAKYVPEYADQCWICTCGAINKTEEENCECCGCSKEFLASNLDPEILNAKLLEYCAIKHEEEEKERAEREEQILVAKEQAEQERKKNEQKVKADEFRNKKKKRRKTALIVTLVSLVLIAAIGCGTVFLGIPLYKYNKASEAFYNGDYDAAHAGFVELGDFKDSAVMANESMYQKGRQELNNGEFESAIQIFTDLGYYKDSQDCILEAKYQKAEQHQEKKQYKTAYELYVELGDYKESESEVLATILLWEAEALGSSATNDSVTFTRTVKLSSDQYEMYYSTILLYLSGHEDIEYWYNGAPTIHSNNVKNMLKLLPVSYKDTSTLVKLFDLFTTTRGSYEKFFRENEELMRECWSLGFIKDLAASDDGIHYFLEGYWSTTGGYYLNFYENDNGGTSCTYNLPWVAEPRGTKYYDIHSLIFVFENGDGKELAKVYRFEIVNYDTIKVYCYKNGRTYTLYR